MVNAWYAVEAQENQVRRAQEHARRAAVLQSTGAFEDAIIDLRTQIMKYDALYLRWAGGRTGYNTQRAYDRAAQELDDKAETL